MHGALDQGITYFDTADAYGDGTSERALGAALRGSRRGRAVVTTKAGYLFRERSRRREALTRAAFATGLVDAVARSRRTSSPPQVRKYAEQDFTTGYLRRALEASLRRLGTDYVDIYQLHGPRTVADDGIVEFVSDLMSEGKIRAFGVGLETLHDATAWVHHPALASIQLPFGVLDPEAADAVIPAASENCVDVVARGVFASGLLLTGASGPSVSSEQARRRDGVVAVAHGLGVSVLQVATWYVAATPGVRTMLIGTVSERHLREALSFLRADPPSSIRDRISEAVAAASLHLS